jgi:hypothetical protein
MDELKELCLCSHGAVSRIDVIWGILGKDIARYGRAVATMLRPGADGDQTRLYGCFAARKLLEAGCIGILGRIDPSRLLILREYQIRSDYAFGERHPAALDWRTDVVSAEKAKWSEGVAPSKFVRSLLGGHLGEVYWLDAIRSIGNVASQVNADALDRATWVVEILDHHDRAAREAAAQAGADPTAAVVELAVLNTIRTRTQQTFSKLSKGVHLEFVVDQDAIFDNETIKATMRDAVKVLTQIAFFSHLIDSAHSALDLTVALNLAASVEAGIENHVS